MGKFTLLTHICVHDLRVYNTGKVTTKPGRGISEDLMQYHENVTKAILGSDQELMKVCLKVCNVLNS